MRSSFGYGLRHFEREIQCVRDSVFPWMIVSGMPKSRTVYSTDKGRLCPKCGWPADNCQCSKKAEGHDPVPTKIIAKLRMEKSGRGGKTVTVVYDLPRNAE